VAGRDREHDVSGRPLVLKPIWALYGVLHNCRITVIAGSEKNRMFLQFFFLCLCLCDWDSFRVDIEVVGNSQATYSFYTITLLRTADASASALLKTNALTEAVYKVRRVHDCLVRVGMHAVRSFPLFVAHTLSGFTVAQVDD